VSNHDQAHEATTDNSLVLREDGTYPERFEDPGHPEHHDRMGDNDPKANKKAERQVVFLFTISILATIGFLIAYFAVPPGDTPESMRLSIYMMSGLGLLIVAFARPIARLFIDDPEVIEDAVMFIQVLGAAQPLMAVDFTLGGALRGAGDTRFPLWSVLIGFYVCRLGFAYTATYVLNLSLFWLWFALVGDYIARALLKGFRFRSGRWKTVSV